MAMAAAVLPEAVGPASAMPVAGGLAAMPGVPKPLHQRPAGQGNQHAPEPDAVGQRENRAIHVRAQPAAHAKCRQHHQKAV